MPILPNLPILAPPFPIPAYLVGGLTLLSTLVASARKIAALRAGAIAPDEPRRFFSYPLLALISLPCLLGFAVGTLYYDFRQPVPGTSTYQALAIALLLANIGTIVCWIYTMLRAARLGRRDWVLNMLSGIALGSPIFSIWGPTQRRAAVDKRLKQPL